MASPPSKFPLMHHTLPARLRCVPEGILRVPNDMDFIGGLRVKQPQLWSRSTCQGRNLVRINVTKIQRERHTLPSEAPYCQLLWTQHSLFGLNPTRNPTLARFEGRAEGENHHGS